MEPESSHLSESVSNARALGTMSFIINSARIDVLSLYGCWGENVEVEKPLNKLYLEKLSAADILPSFITEGKAADSPKYLIKLKKFALILNLWLRI